MLSSGSNGAESIGAVMAGLVPAIHVVNSRSRRGLHDLAVALDKLMTIS
jgi:hypothetical protein